MMGRTSTREVEEKGAGDGRRGGRWEEGGGRWETEGREVGEEKFVKWEKMIPPPNKWLR
jgi:hypothetical protein